MASAALIDDRLQIDGFDAYTWSGTFGVPNNGGFYSGPDGTYVVQRDERETTYVDKNDDLSHFTQNQLNRSGPMYLAESAASPAPFLGFPARKFEYPDFSVTWTRGKWNGHVNKGQDLIIVLVLVVILIMMFRSRMK